ncbi:MAG: menaquinone biosynthetic enzyme MqnA/MqnD family protein [Bacteroidia bacterium]
MKKINISVVSYLNTLPFIYGLENYFFAEKGNLFKDTPAECALKITNNIADVGLIPVAAINGLSESYIISDYCIGSKGKVNSVLLLSDVPLEKIKFIFTDYQSRTSVLLLKILLHHHWHCSPLFLESSAGYEELIKNDTAGLVIGDRALLLQKKYQYAYDLSEAWYEMTSLPFVFACWVANKKLPDQFILNFNNALKYGMNHLKEAVNEYDKKYFSQTEIKNYLTNSISYSFDAEKKKAMKLFFEMVSREEKIAARESV